MAQKLPPLPAITPVTGYAVAGAVGSYETERAALQVARHMQLVEYLQNHHNLSWGSRDSPREVIDALFEVCDIVDKQP